MKPPVVPRDARRRTIIGEFAARVARLSRLYLTIIVGQANRIVTGIIRLTRRVVIATYDAYRRFEAFFAAAITDLLLFIWALRNFALLIGLQLGLVIAATRWPILWIAAIAMAILLLTAAIEMTRDSNKEFDDAVSPLDDIRELVYRVVLWIQRVVLLLAGASVTMLFVWSNMTSAPSPPETQFPEVVAVDTMLPPESATSVVNGQSQQDSSNHLTNVHLSNKCTDMRIWIAIHYQDNQGVWTTSAWYGVKPGATRESVVTVTGARVYFFGHSARYGRSGRKTWAADKSDQSKSLHVVDDRFVAVNDKLTGSRVRREMFFGKDIKGLPQYTQFFACSN